MTYYLLLHDNVLSEILPDFVEDFPGVPARERYTPELLRQCLVRESLEGIELNMTYDPETEAFYWPEPAPMQEPVGPTNPIPAPDEERDMLLVDHEYRLSLLELEGTANAV